MELFEEKQPFLKITRHHDKDSLSLLYQLGSETTAYDKMK